jgi:anhydro-N-acetylmuramic acid kinase
MALFIGLMSGTSLDGIDGVLVDFGSTAGPPLRLVGHQHRPFDAALRGELLALNQRGNDELHRASLAAGKLVQDGASVVQALLAVAGITPQQVRAIGSHGQTLRHRPLPADGGYTLQIDNGALLAELTGIDVVCDFRRRDVAAGGQGAPLVCAFHAAMFAEPGVDVAVLNLGGQSNLSLLRADGSLCGFDCGPANALLDGWTQRHTGASFDDGGAWAASGQVHAGLLKQLLADPYFALAPPKSTGRDQFHLAWLEAHLGTLTVAPADVQATLAELTASIIATDLQRHAPRTQRLLVCGGGAHNRHLMQRLASLLPSAKVETTATAGLDVTQVEAAAFAWLAHAHLLRQPGNRMEVTGARGPRVLGALYPA